MRILLWTHRFAPDIGGVQSVVQDLGADLAARGHDVHVLTSLLSLRDPFQESLRGMAVHRIPFVAWNGSQAPDSAALSALFVHIIDSLDVDVVNFHYAGLLSPYVLACAAHLHVPLLVTVHGSDVHELTQQSDQEQRIVRTLLGAADLITTVSQELLRSVASLVPLDRERLVCIRNGIVPQHSIMRGSTASQLSINPFSNLRPYLVSVGRIVPVKRFDLLLSAFAELDVERYGAHRLLILGDGSCMDALREQARNLGIADRVVLGGAASRDLVFATMRDAEALVLSSENEGLPTVLLEAMAVGCPVVATRVGGVPEVVEHRRTGILVEPGSPTALRGGIEEISAGGAQRVQLIQTAREFVLAHYTVERMTSQYEQAYKDCLSKKS